MPDRTFNDLATAAVLDLRTGHPDPEHARIIEVAVVLVDFSLITPDTRSVSGKTLHTLVNPKRRYHRKALQMAGLTRADLVNQPAFSEIASELRELIGRHPVVGHNVRSLRNSLSAQLKRVGLPSLFRNRMYCTLHRVRQLRNRVERSQHPINLSDAAALLGVDAPSDRRRTSLENAQITANLAAKLYQIDAGMMPGYEADLRERATQLRTAQQEELRRARRANPVFAMVPPKGARGLAAPQALPEPTPTEPKRRPFWRRWFSSSA